MLETRSILDVGSAMSVSRKTMFDARVHSIQASTNPEKIALELRLSQTLLQADIYVTDVEKKVWENAMKLTTESIVRVSGHLTSCDRRENNGETGNTSAKCQRICISGLEIIALACQDIWAGKQKSVSLEDRLDNRILDVRHAAAGAIFKLHSGMCQLMVEFLCSNGFHWIHTPRFITATVAGDNEYFGLPYFGGNAWLAQSTQHHKQMALSMDMQRVFEIGPVFRSETKSLASSRHLTEFTVLDIGMVFQDDYHEVVEMVELMLLFVMRGLQERKQYRSLIETIKEVYPSTREFNIGLDKNGKVPRVTFLEAKRILRNELKLETNDSQNFTQEEEAILGSYFQNSSRSGGTDIFTIDQYPSSMRQFNSQANKQDPGYSNTWDTIVRGREICSGSQRINSYYELCKAMRGGVCGPPLDPDAEEWKPYMTAFKTGMPRHGGCGLGVNRLLQGFLGLNDVREVTMFPRDGRRLAP